MLARNVNCPVTSSAGRLFDSVAALAGLRPHVTFEGQAAMELEFLIDEVVTDEFYRIPSGSNGMIDWVPAIHAILKDLEDDVALPIVAAKFHNSLIEALVEIAHGVGETQVVMSGGCFQNKYLIERAISRLSTEGFQPYWHRRVPPNDGGISLGQIIAARLE
jgi:hydrogenase maturation protein HypF